MILKNSLYRDSIYEQAHYRFRQDLEYCYRRRFQNPARDQLWDEHREYLCERLSLRISEHINHQMREDMYDIKT